jgi:tRNA (guanine9-N1)-methyltransferase
MKLERRAKEKEAKKEKKRILAAKLDAGELDVDGGEVRKRKRQKTTGAAQQRGFGGRVVLDLGFDDMMTDKVGVLSDVFISCKEAGGAQLCYRK